MPDPTDWESFYRNYRKPGYVAGYEIHARLGSGAFGVVFKATKTSIGKPYAIKFLKIDDVATRDAVERELDSVRLFAQVDHPNLVSIEDQGVIDGVPYIVMAFAGEETLRQRIDNGRIQRDEALRLFAQVCRGVQALHDHSLVHFDIKPANVYLQGDVARIGDYGLSKLVSASRNSLSMGRGTPYYMAPELLRRRGDARSDVYALGILLYEMLSGTVPFLGQSEWEVLRKHEDEAPRFPASIDPRERRVIERALAKDPERRYQSVAEMSAALVGDRSHSAGDRAHDNDDVAHSAALQRATGPAAKTPGSIPPQVKATTSGYPTPPRAQRPSLALAVVLLAALIVPLLWFASGSESSAMESHAWSTVDVPPMPRFAPIDVPAIQFAMDEVADVGPDDPSIGQAVTEYVAQLGLLDAIAEQLPEPYDRGALDVLRLARVRAGADGDFVAALAKVASPRILEQIERALAREPGTAKARRWMRELRADLEKRLRKPSSRSSDAR